MTVPLELRAFLGLLALALFGAAAWALRNRSTARSLGAPVAFDDGRGGAVDLVSDAWGLVGRPDEIRRDRAGNLVPVEIKSHAAPRGGPYASHRVQVEAYCLLLESTTGRPPPYGVIAYAGGANRIVPWNADARREVVRLLGEVRRSYDGRATPSAGKCAGCRWRPGCDARAG